jgi:chemotaxis protein histidine kinase CheA
MARSKAEWTLRFKQEATQHVQALIDELDKFEKISGLAENSVTTELGLSEPELVNLHELLRLAHTIKGSAAMVALFEISSLALQLEQTFNESYRAEERLTPTQRQAAQALISQLQLKIAELPSAGPS